MRLKFHLCFSKPMICAVLLVIMEELHVQATSICYLPTCKSEKPRMLSELCAEPNVTVVGRCCIQKNSSDSEHIVGIDLSDCGLTSLGDVTSISGSIKQNISFLGAYNNPVSSCQVDINGMIDLQTVWWPANCTCPGGNRSWSIVKHNFPSNIRNTYCVEQIDLCKKTNIICPEQSQCLMNGPGNALCDCERSWHGYKCLRQDTFPMLIFSIGILTGVIVLSAFLWFLFRRKVQKLE